MLYKYLFIFPIIIWISNYTAANYIEYNGVDFSFPKRESKRYNITTGYPNSDGDYWNINKKKMLK